MRHSIWIALTLVLMLVSGCTTRVSPLASGAKPAAKSNAPQAKSQAPAAPVNQPDATAQEKAKFVGTWTAIEGEYQGQRMGADALKDMKWTFTADKVTYPFFGRTFTANYTVQPSTSPKQFDFKGAETAIQGIYELKGDTLKVCLAGTERPMSFATGGTSMDTLMFVFKKAGQ